MSARLKPTRTSLAAAAGLIWALGWGAARDLLIADLRGGMLSLKGFSRAGRFVIVAGFAVLALVLIGLVLSATWREVFSLRTLPGGQIGRGSLVPEPLVPFTLLIVALGTAYILTGAIHSTAPLKIGVLAFYICAASVWSGFAAGLSKSSHLTAIGWLGVAAVVVFFAVRWPAQPKPALEFGVLLALVVLTFAAGQQRLADFDRTSGGSVPFALGQVDQTVELLSGFVLPLMFLIGLDIAEFAIRVGDFVGGVVEERTPRWFLAGAVAIAGGLNLWEAGGTLRDNVLDTSFGEEARNVLAAGVVPVVAVGVWWLVHHPPEWLPRRPALPGSVPDYEEEDVLEPTEITESSRRTGVVLTIVIFLPLLVGTVLQLITQFVLSVDALSDLDNVRRLAHLSRWVSDRTGLWEELAGPIAIAFAAFQYWRGRTTSTIVLATTGFFYLWIQLTAPGRPLDFLPQSHARDDAIWSFVIIVVALAWLVRRRITGPRLRGLMLILPLAWLLPQINFLENPLSIFGLGGALGIGIGFVFDTCVYGEWASESSHRLPRTSRVMLYVGYALFAAALVNWALVTHNLDDIQLYTGQGAQFGFTALGQPLLYVLILSVLIGRPEDEIAVVDEGEEPPPVSTRHPPTPPPTARAAATPGF